MTTHKERLLSMLADGCWHCGEEFLEARFYTWSQRASEVNRTWPGRIINRPCPDKRHHCDQYRDEYAAQPKQLALAV